MATITNAAVKTIRDLFNESSETIRVPTSVQRQYSWEGEAETFYQDVRRFAKDSTDGDDYFMGSILTVWNAGNRHRDLIDGQQRLTTATILLAAMRDALWRLQSGSARVQASSIQQMFIAYALDESDPKKYFMELTKFDKDFFRNHIQDWNEETGKSPESKPAENPSNRLIAAVKKRFDKNILDDIANLETEDKKRKWILEMRTVLVRQIQFVEVTTSSEDDANEIFETINDRGLKLSPLDLLRNFLLTNAKPHERTHMDDSWEAILQKGRDATELGQLLRHYWISKHGDVRAQGLYKEVKKSLEAQFQSRTKDPKQGQTAPEFVADLEENSRTYFNLRRAEVDNAQLKDALTEISELGAQSLYPVLLSAVKEFGEPASAPLAQTLVSYYVRWSVIGRKESTLLESTMFGLSKRLREEKISITGAIKELKDNSESDELFKASFKIVTIGRQAWRRHVLVRLEDAMRKSLGQTELKVGSPQTVHIEHIYPQTPDDPPYRLKNHEELVNRIGNLTLLQGSKNIAARNSPLPIKIAGPYEGTEIRLTLNTDIKALWNYDTERWNPAGIEARQVELAQYAPGAWPL